MSGRNLYTLFGLTLGSELPLPELVAAPAGARPDVAIRLGRVDDDDLPDVGPRYRLMAAPDEIRMHWEGVATFQISSGEQIVVNPLPEVAPEVVRLFVLGVALALLLHQRGLTVLHASAVVIDGRGVAIVGEKGWGKSTLTAALVSQGAPLLTDDLAPIVECDGRPTLLPGIPQIKLWPPSLAAIGRDAEACPRLHDQVDKRCLDVSDCYHAEPVELGWILSLGGGEQPAIEPLRPAEALLHLMPHWYAARYGPAMLTALGAERHLRQCAWLARNVGCARLTRTADLDDLAQVVELLRDHLGRQSTLS